MAAEIAYLLQNIRRMFAQIAESGTCRGCGREIWWITHKNGKKAPYTLDGLNHFADCPAAAKFKKNPESGKYGVGSLREGARPSTSTTIEKIDRANITRDINRKASTHV